MSDDDRPVGATGECAARSWGVGVAGASVGLVLVALVVTGVAARGAPSGAVDDFVVAAPPVAPPAAAVAAPSTDAVVTTDRAVGGAAQPSASSSTEAALGVETGTGAGQSPPAADDAAVVDPSRVDPDWVARVSSAAGIPARALQAYGNAVLTLAAEDPGCRIGWPTLAGIGQVESGHGRAGLDDDGRPARPIVGPALDGGPGRAAIHATPESTAWHGDPVWDHAVGPMQFIPSTWRRWAADGDRDGAADPQDIDDASLAAARYLCAGARDLSTADGWTAAIYSYNHSDAYVQKVYAAASSYSAAAG